MVVLMQVLVFWQAFNTVVAARQNKMLNDYMPDSNDQHYKKLRDAYNWMKRMVCGLGGLAVFV